jgi:hypothetical protein
MTAREIDEQAAAAIYERIAATSERTCAVAEDTRAQLAEALARDEAVERRARFRLVEGGGDDA